MDDRPGERTRRERFDSDRGIARIARLSPEQRQAHRAEIGLFSQRPRGPAGLVAKHDVIDANVAPPTPLIIDNLEASRFACPLAHIPTLPSHPVVVLPGRAQHDLFVHQQVYTSAPSVRPSTYQE